MTEDPEDWHERRKRFNALMATELGQLYRAHEKALIDYWRVDGNEDIGGNKLMQLDQISKDTTHAFVTKLMELAGV
jgi:hypothetical protein